MTTAEFRISMIAWAGAALALAVSCGGGSANQAGKAGSQGVEPGSHRIVLGNGATVLLYPAAGTGRVAIEAIYKVGFMDEPEGMTQAAHLLEHLVCQGSTRSFAQRESMAQLNEMGQANAETLADWTHYDYVVPPGKLEFAIGIEAERLTSLAYTEELIAGEALKCYSEAQFVERNPRAGMLKHGFMALNQSWRHGAEEAEVKSGLERIGVEKLRAFHQSYYRPENLILVVAGDFDPDQALDWIQSDLGSIAPPQEPPGARPVWRTEHKESTIRWDSTVRAVCLTYEPPPDPAERLILTYWGPILARRLASDPDLSRSAEAIHCSGRGWSVGRLPFFVYATAKPGVALEELEQLLKAKVRAAVKDGPARELRGLKAMARQSAAPPDLRPEAIEKAARAIARMQGIDAAEAKGLVLGNMALQIGLRDLDRGSEGTDRLEKIANLEDEQFRAVLERSLNPTQLNVTRLEPVAARN